MNYPDHIHYTKDVLRNSVRRIVDHAQRCPPGEPIAYSKPNVHFWNRIVFLCNVAFFVNGKPIVLRWSKEFEVTVDKKPTFDMPVAQKKVHDRRKLESAIDGAPSPDNALRQISELAEKPVAGSSGQVSIGQMRNAPCYCGSGKKFKKCCLGKMQSAADYGNTAGEKQRNAGRFKVPEVKA